MQNEEMAVGIEPTTLADESDEEDANAESIDAESNESTTSSKNTEFQEEACVRKNQISCDMCTYNCKTKRR